jgi:hypothetical protein
VKSLGVIGKALAAQVAGWLIVLLTLFVIANTGGSMPSVWLIGVIQAAGSVAVAYLLQSDRWWLVIHLIFSAAVIVFRQTGVDPTWYLVAFLVLLFIFGPSYRSRVPLYLSNQKTINAVSDWLIQQGFAERKDARFLDFGSGTGSMILGLAKRHPEQQFVGVEAAWFPYLLSWLRALSQKNVQVSRKSFWDISLADYPVVYAFLSTEPMPRLWEKVKQEMSPGAFLISNSFIVPNVKPQQTLSVNDDRQTSLYVYRI